MPETNTSKPKAGRQIELSTIRRGSLTILIVFGIVLLSGLLLSANWRRSDQNTNTDASQHRISSLKDQPEIKAVQTEEVAENPAGETAEDIELEEVAGEGAEEEVAISEEETSKIVDRQDLFLYDDLFDLSTGGTLKLQARFPYQTEESATDSSLAYLWLGDEDSDGIYFGVDYSAGTLLFLNNGDEDSDVPIIAPHGPHGDTLRLTPGRSVFLSMRIVSDGSNLFLSLSPTSKGVTRVRLDADATQWLDMAAIKVGLGSNASPERFCVLKGESNCLEDIGVEGEEKAAEENSEEGTEEAVAEEGVEEVAIEEELTEEDVEEKITEEVAEEGAGGEIAPAIPAAAVAVDEGAEEITEEVVEEVLEGESGGCGS